MRNLFLTKSSFDQKSDQTEVDEIEVTGHRASMALFIGRNWSWSGYCGSSQGSDIAPCTVGLPLWELNLSSMGMTGAM